MEIGTIRVLGQFFRLDGWNVNLNLFFIFANIMSTVLTAPAGNILLLQYGYVHSSHTANLTGQSMSLSAWVKRIGTGNRYDCAFVHEKSAPFGLCYRDSSAQSGQPDGFTFAFWDDDLDTQPYPDDRLTWVHWVATYNSSASGGQRQRAIYRNGSKVVTDFADRDYEGDGKIIVGGGNTFSSTLAIDDARVYIGRVLSDQDIRRLYQGESISNDNLFLHYTFDDPPGSTIVQDMSTNQNNGTIVPTAEVHQICPDDSLEASNNVCQSLLCPQGSSRTWAQDNAGVRSSCANCSVGKYKPLVGTGPCLRCGEGKYTNTTGASACFDYAVYTYAQVPEGPSFGPCELPHLSWQVDGNCGWKLDRLPVISTLSRHNIRLSCAMTVTHVARAGLIKVGGRQEVIQREVWWNVTAWTGGLGSQMTNETEVWVCLAQAFDSPDCPTPPDLACYVYNEAKDTFAYWGPNSQLRLTRT